MTTYIERRPFNILTMFDGLEDYLKTGDPEVREWFLVRSNFWPIFLCTAYLLTIKVIGPALMRDRKPFELRKTMIAYNMFLVVAYGISVSIVIYCMFHTDHSVMCKNTVVTKENLTYTMATCGWVIYLLKYAEFLDTIFFVLRKKDKLITNLHVIHHTSLPICGWIFFRTEKSGFQAYPIIINSIVHIVMYSYYGLAAMGPSVRKYLWWKRYLTITNLHVIHHTSLPICGWIFFRTEKSGFQAYPIIINSIVHIVMYSYYGLAAMGPSVRKYLWWKRYLTIAQMIQFILIIVFVTVVMPLAGCTAAKTSIYINIVAATLFFALFYNFYQHSFKPTKAAATSANGNHKKPITNGNSKYEYVEEKVKCN